MIVKIFPNLIQYAIIRNSHRKTLPSASITVLKQGLALWLLVVVIEEKLVDACSEVVEDELAEVGEVGDHLEG